jgi:hypothetical protein
VNLVVPNRGSPKDTLTIARRWLDEFEQVALATVISTWGSSPVPVGGQLIVGPNGPIRGTCVRRMRRGRGDYRSRFPPKS